MDLWASRNSRERLMVMGCGAFAGLALIYALVLEPLVSGLSRYRHEVPVQRTELVWMQEAARQVRELSVVGRTTAGYGTSPLAAIDRMARKMKIAGAIRRVEPDGKEQVKVWLEDVVFDDLIRWCRFLSMEYGIQVAGLTAEQRPEPGYVSVRVIFKGVK